MSKQKRQTFCGKNNCESYDCIYHYSNAPWNELINVFSPTLTKEKQCKDYDNDTPRS